MMERSELVDSLNNPFGVAGNPISVAVVAGAGAFVINNVVLVPGLVAGLGAPVAGSVKLVSDALAPVVGVAVVGGGASRALVWGDGASWIVITL